MNTTASPAQNLLASMLESIQQGESERVEFKSSFQKEVIETLTAFANSQGGAVLIGVNDATEISDAHIKLINSSWDYHPDPEHTLASISEAKVQAFAAAIKVDAPFTTVLEKFELVKQGRPTFACHLLDNLTVEKIKTGHYKSHLRNKQIATIFKELELIEKYGSGVRRVIDTFVAYGLREPEFEATQGGMAVTVFKAPTGGVNEGVNEGVIEGVNEGVNGLLNLIQRQPALRGPAMAETMQTSPKNIERWLKQLKQEQKIEFRGAPKTGGYYALNATGSDSPCPRSLPHLKK